MLLQRDRLVLRRPGDRHVEQRLDRVDVLFGILHADEILVVADRVDPEVLLVELDAGIERGDHVLHDLGLVQPEVGGLGAVDLDDVLGIVEPLDDPGSRPRRRSAATSRLNRLGDLRGPCAGSCRDADVDRRRLAFVHGRRGSCRRRRRRTPGRRTRGSLAKPSRSRSTYSWAECSRSCVELHLDDRVHRAGVGRVGGRPVGRHAQSREMMISRSSPIVSRTNCFDLRRSSSRSPRSACRWRRGRRSRRRRRRPRGRTRGAAACPRRQQHRHQQHDGDRDRRQRDVAAPDRAAARTRRCRASISASQLREGAADRAALGACGMAVLVVRPRWRPMRRRAACSQAAQRDGTNDRDSR